MENLAEEDWLMKKIIDQIISQSDANFYNFSNNNIKVEIFNIES